MYRSVLTGGGKMTASCRESSSKKKESTARKGWGKIQKENVGSIKTSGHKQGGTAVTGRATINRREAELK